MSHRNGKPKPSASSRTLRRYRVRNDVETENDRKHFELIDKIKDPIRKLDIKLSELKVK